MIWKGQIYHQHIVDNIMFYISKGIFLTNLIHVKSKMCCYRPHQDAIITQPICLYKVLLNMKYVSMLSMNLLESWSITSGAKLSKSLTVYLSVVNDSKKRSKIFAILYAYVCKADKIFLKGGFTNIFSEVTLEIFTHEFF